MTARLPLDAEALLLALRNAEIDFLVIGGFAVSAHGYPRATRDLDIVPDSDSANLERLAGLLEDLDSAMLGSDEFDPGELIQPDVDGLRGGGSYVLETKLGRLDIMQHLPPGLEYKDLIKGAIHAEIFGNAVRFCGFDDLIEMKLASGRPEDLLDVERLKEAREERG